MNNISEKDFYLTFFNDTPYAIQMSVRKNGGLAIIQCMWTYGLFNDAISISDLERLLSFGLQSFLFPFAVYEYKD